MFWVIPDMVFHGSLGFESRNAGCCCSAYGEIQIPFFFCGLRWDSEGSRVGRSRVEGSRVEE
jgi:hypothetical protein